MLSNISPLPTLPSYPGPYKVGTVEVEIPVEEITTARKPFANISTIKFRLFYPTQPDSVSKDAVYWLPEPQKQSNEAFASFIGADSGWRSYLVTSILSVWKSVRLPAVRSAPLLSSLSHPFPVCVFSHGLGGTTNNYSSIAGTLASCGTVCLATEHRDGSSPISLIRNAQGQIESSVMYKKLKHNPDTETLNARNAQLRTRIWELEQVHTIIQALNDGHTFSNYATIANEKDNNAWKSLQATFEQRLNVSPGQITWAGHSFGAATTVQFIKSVFYEQSTPSGPEKAVDGGAPWDWTPLYQKSTDSALAKQITPDSPVALFDLWTMPLRGDVTKWLFDKPMPCYSRKVKPDSVVVPSVVAIMSAEFNGYTDLANRTKAVLSHSPAEAVAKYEKRRSSMAAQSPATKPTEPLEIRTLVPELSKEPIELAVPEEDVDSETSSNITLRPDGEQDVSLEPHLYTIPQSAHLSQSDFGVLFPNLTKMIMKAIDPQKTLQLNIRAALAVMRGRGLPVSSLTMGHDHILEEQLLTGEQREDRWVRVPL